MSIILPRFAVIVAGGLGLRMNADTPKQFMLMAGKPVIIRALSAFFEYDPTIRTILVLHHDLLIKWNELQSQYGFNFPIELAEGGAERSESVRNGLSGVPDDALVAIHDGVRPLVTPGLIARAFDTAAEKGCAIPVVPVRDSLREIDPAGSRVVDRSQLFQVQTPQTFHAGRIKDAYRSAGTANFTDDASVWELAGFPLEFIAGEMENIKITVAADLAIAEKLIGLPST